MARHISKLKVGVRDFSTIQLRFPQNQAYLDGLTDEPVLGADTALYRYFSYALMAISAVLLPAYIAFCIFIWLWTSPYAMTTQGTIDGLADDWNIRYSYEVDGVRYDKVEPYPSRSPQWADGGVPQTIVYISFWPSQSRLPRNVEAPEWFPMIFGGLMLLLLGLMGYALMHDRRMERRLSHEATHVLEGVIAHLNPLYRGILVAVYHTNSPDGQQIIGKTHIGRFDQARGRIVRGTPVAILYRDDKLHAIL